MKRILKISWVMVLLAYTTISINAAAFSVGTSKKTVAPGGTFQVNVNFSGEGRFDFQVSNGSLSNSTFWYPDSRSVTVTAGQSGNVTVTVISTNITNTNAEQMPKETVTITVPISSASTGGGGSTPGTPTPKPPVKTPEQLENEKKEAEAKELEKRKITPLISSISVISKSEKRADDVLIAFNPGESEFALEYTLPKRIENFSLDIAADEGVTLDYVADYVMDADEKVITIKAIGSEFTQEYALTVKRDLREDAVLTVGDTPMKVYTDDLLTERMSAFGFTYEEYPLNELISSYFTLGENKIQLLVDESNNARWYMLSGELIPTREVVLSVFNEKPFIIYDADDVDVIDEKLHGNSYVKHDLVVPESLATVDSTLKFKTDYLAWDYKDGEVVYGYGYEGKDGMHYLTDVEVVGAALVAFDQVDTSMRTIAIVSTTGFIIVSAYVLVTTLMNVRKRKSLQ